MIADFLRYHPSRPLHWRYQRIVEVVRHGKWPDPQNDDDQIRAGCKFLRQLDLARTASQKKAMVATFPALAGAHELSMTSDPRLKFVIESRILAGQCDDEIAAKTGCSPETVYWFEALYFCVRDRLGYPGYIVNMTKRGPIYEEPTEVEIKLFAYFGGRVVLEHLLCPHQVLERIDDGSVAPTYFDETNKLHLRQQATLAALTMRIDKSNAMEFQRLHVRLMEIAAKTAAVRDTHKEAEQAAEEAIDALAKTMNIRMPKSHKSRARRDPSNENSAARNDKRRPDPRQKKPAKETSQDRSRENPGS